MMQYYYYYYLSTSDSMQSKVFCMLVAIAALAIQTRALTLADQINGTQFVQGTQCYPNSNSWLVRIKNGFATPSTFQVQLNYDSGVSSTGSFVLQPFQNSNITAVFPVNGGVGNRYGLLNLIVNNPNYNNGVPVMIRSLPVTCGAVVQNQADTDCHYVNIGCLISNGWCLGNAFCWILIYIVVIIVGAVAIAFTWVVTEKTRLERFVYRESPSKKKQAAESRPQRGERPRNKEEAMVEPASSLAYNHSGYDEPDSTTYADYQQRVQQETGVYDSRSPYSVQQ